MQNELDNKRIMFFDGVKGLACLFVMFGHFNCFVSLAEDLKVIPCAFKTVFQKPFLYVFVCESFWLYLFFIVSGYLLAMGRVENIADVIRKALKRVLRFLLPIFGAFLFIYFLQIIIGFHNAETVYLIENSFYQSYYPVKVTLFQCFIEPFIVVLTEYSSYSAINSPYWVIGSMFYSSIIIYISQLMYNRIPKIKLLIAAASLGLAFVLFRFNGFACVLGMVLYWYSDKLCKITENRLAYYLLWVFVIAMPLGLQSCIYSLLCGILPNIPDFLDFGGVYGIVYFPILIILLKKGGMVSRALETKPFRFLGKISFGIYSFHWPVFCSAGALTLMTLAGKTSVSVAVISMYAVTIVLTFLLAIIYSGTIEKWSLVAVKSIDERANRLISKIKI